MTLYIILYLLIGASILLRLEYMDVGHHDYIFHEEDVSDNAKVVLFWPALLFIAVIIFLMKVSAND